MVQIRVSPTQFCCTVRGSHSAGASIAQWQSVGLVNQRSWVQSSLEATLFSWNLRTFHNIWVCCGESTAVENIYCFNLLVTEIFPFLVDSDHWESSLLCIPPSDKIFLTPTWFEHAAFWSGVRRATVAPRSHIVLIKRILKTKKQRFYRDLNSDRWIQSPEC